MYKYGIALHIYYAISAKDFRALGEMFVSRLLNFQGVLLGCRVAHVTLRFGKICVRRCANEK